VHDLPGARRVAGLLTMALLAGCGSGSGGDESTRTAISTNAITFNAAITDSATPTSQVFTASFGSDIAHLGVVHTGNAINTVTSTLNGRTATITVEPTAPGTVGPGAFVGAVAVTGYTCADATCSKLAAGTTSTVSINYQVSPVVQLVTPYVATSGTSDEVVIRGIGLTSFNVQEVRFGDVAATGLRIPTDSTSEIRATHPALAAGTYPVRLVASNHQGAIPTTATLVVVDPTTYAAMTLAHPSSTSAVRSLIYDAERRALLVVTDAGGGTITRYAYDGTTWNITGAASAGLVDVALSTKGTGLYGITSTGFVPVDPVTVAIGTAVAAPSLPADVFLRNIVVGNDDVGLVTTGRTTGSTPTNVYLYVPVGNVLVGQASAFNNATPVMAANGTIAYMTQSDPSFTADVGVGRYAVSGNAFSTSTAVLTRQNAVLPALSRTANRLVVNGVRVYDGTEDLFGLLASTTTAVALKSDGTRAYAYDATLGGIVTYDISADRGGEVAHPSLGPVVPLAGDPGTNVRMTISPDGRTLFLAGSTQIVVQPTPAL
jgi:hypothetical protein